MKDARRRKKKLESLSEKLRRKLCKERKKDWTRQERPYRDWPRRWMINRPGSKITEDEFVVYYLFLL